jgi:hypothetical protein
MEEVVGVVPRLDLRETVVVLAVRGTHPVLPLFHQDALAQALERYERKRNLSMARTVRNRLAELQPA